MTNENKTIIKIKKTKTKQDFNYFNKIDRYY